jgi:hypothetical protein
MHMNRDTLLSRLVLGAGAGLAGTMAIQTAMKTQQKLVPAATAPVRQDPAEFMLSRIPMPDKMRPLALKATHLGYGMTFGALYAALRRRPRNVMLEGALLGVATWAVGYLGWLPATRLTPKPQHQSKPQLAGPIATHVVYGITTVAAYSRM